jgi:hypothetical protein
MGLKGNLGTLSGLKKRLRSMPVTVAHDVAQKAAPVLTRELEFAYDAGRSVYGDVWQLGADGSPVTLERTGATRSLLAFTATGTIIRAVLGTSWARFLIGKYGILPNGAMPAHWPLLLARVVRDVRVGDILRGRAA